MERLVTRLLHLARAETVNPGEDTCDVPKVLASVVTRFLELGVNITAAPFQIGEGACVVRMTDETLDALLTNFLDNARQHGGPGVRVTLSVAAALHNDAAAIRIDVIYNGPGISPANLNRVFDAFFTTARENGWTGLGLAIVRATAAAHGGKATLSSAGEGQGTIASLILPRLV